MATALIFHERLQPGTAMYIILTAIISFASLSDLNLHFEGLVRAVIFCNVPEQFKSSVHAFYSLAFQAYQSINKKEDGQMDTSGLSS